MILDHLMMVMMLAITFTFLICDIKKNLESAQPVKVKFKLSATTLAEINGYALALPNKLVSIGCDGQSHLDSI